MLATVGRRALGDQVAETLAIARWLGERHGVPVDVVAKGSVAGVAALLATVLDTPEPDSGAAPAIRRTRAACDPRTLSRLVEDDVSYSAMPELFCFGLLEIADVEDLVRLASGRALLASDAGPPPAAADR